MSAKGIEEVLSRAMSDSAFADRLFANSDEALVGFDLTTEEAAKFKNLSRADFEKLAQAQAQPEERWSFARFRLG